MAPEGLPPSASSHTHTLQVLVLGRKAVPLPSLRALPGGPFSRRKAKELPGELGAPTRENSVKAWVCLLSGVLNGRRGRGEPQMRQGNAQVTCPASSL